MKKNIALSALAMAMLAGFSLNANAIDSNITFNGVVTATTCTLNASDATKTLTLPTLSPTNLASAGNISVNINQASTSFNFTGCPATLTKIITAVTAATGTFYGTYDVFLPSASNVSLVAALSPASGVNFVFPNGTVSSANSIAITPPPTSGGTSSAVVPFTVGVRAQSAVTPTKPAPVAGTYTGTYNLSFTYV